MNANELADEMMKFYNLEENTAPIQIYDLVATMLRQQQAEIEALKSHPVKELTDKEITEIYFDDPDILVFARAILRKAQEK